jgi:hypothetical protein
MTYQTKLDNLVKAFLWLPSVVDCVAKKLIATNTAFDGMPDKGLQRR